MDEHRHPASGKDYVGRARQITAMQSESVAGSEQRTACEDLGPCVLAAYAGHHPASDGRLYNITH
jgi:hypothetical protein